MKKYAVYALVIVIFTALVSCKELSKNNPYDPAGTDYAGITYKGQIWYPGDTDIKAMITVSGQLVLAGYNDTDGFCVMKMTGDDSYYAVGGTGDVPGTFNDITDICADDSGTIYAVDKKNIVQTISTSNIMGSWPVSYTVGIDNLSIECLNNVIFITNILDKTVTKYTLAGTLVDTLVLSTTAYGNFIPGRIFRSASYLYVVNTLDTSIIVKLSDTLANAGEFDFEDYIMDGAMAGTQLQLAAGQAMYNVDDDLGVNLKWGNFGVGPGRVLNGKVVTYDSTTGSVFVLDGLTIKEFGD